MEGVFIKGYLGQVAGKFLNKFVEKKTGFNPKIDVKNIELKVDDPYVTVDMSLTISKSQFDKLMEEITK